MAVRKKLGEILVEQGAANPEHVKRALGHQRQWGGKVGRILVDMKLVTEEQLAKALAAQSRMPLAKMKAEIPASVTGLLPIELAEKHEAIAFGMRTVERVETVYVAISDPFNMEGMDEIRFHLRKQVKFALAPADEIKKAIAHAGGGDSLGIELDAIELPNAAPLSAPPEPPPSPEPAPVPSDPLADLMGAPASMPAAAQAAMPAADPFADLFAPPAPAPAPATSDIDELLGLGAPAPAPSASSALDDLFDAPSRPAPSPARPAAPAPVPIQRFAPVASRPTPQPAPPSWAQEPVPPAQPAAAAPAAPEPSADALASLFDHSSPAEALAIEETSSESFELDSSSPAEAMASMGMELDSFGESSDAPLQLESGADAAAAMTLGLVAEPAPDVAADAPVLELTEADALPGIDLSDAEAETSEADVVHGLAAETQLETFETQDPGAAPADALDVSLEEEPPAFDPAALQIDLAAEAQVAPVELDAEAISVEPEGFGATSSPAPAMSQEPEIEQSLDLAAVGKAEETAIEIGLDEEAQAPAAFAAVEPVLGSAEPASGPLPFDLPGASIAGENLGLGLSIEPLPKEEAGAPASVVLSPDFGEPSTFAPGIAPEQSLPDPAAILGLADPAPAVEEEQLDVSFEDAPAAEPAAEPFAVPAVEPAEAQGAQPFAFEAPADEAEIDVELSASIEEEVEVAEAAPVVEVAAPEPLPAFEPAPPIAYEAASLDVALDAELAIESEPLPAPESVLMEAGAAELAVEPMPVEMQEPGDAAAVAAEIPEVALEAVGEQAVPAFAVEETAPAAPPASEELFSSFEPESGSDAAAPEMPPSQGSLAALSATGAELFGDSASAVAPEAAAEEPLPSIEGNEASPDALPEQPVFESAGAAPGSEASAPAPDSFDAFGPAGAELGADAGAEAPQPQLDSFDTFDPTGGEIGPGPQAQAEPSLEAFGESFDPAGATGGVEQVDPLGALGSDPSAAPAIDEAAAPAPELPGPSADGLESAAEEGWSQGLGSEPVAEPQAEPAPSEMQIEQTPTALPEGETPLDLGQGIDLSQGAAAPGDGEPAAPESVAPEANAWAPPAPEAASASEADSIDWSSLDSTDPAAAQPAPTMSEEAAVSTAEPGAPEPVPDWSQLTMPEDPAPVAAEAMPASNEWTGEELDEQIEIPLADGMGEAPAAAVQDFQPAAAPVFEEQPPAQQVSPHASLLDDLRRIAEGVPLEGKAPVSAERLGRVVVKQMLDKGFINADDLLGMLAISSEKLSASVVKILLERGFITADDVVSMLAIPPERLNASVLLMLVERGVFDPESVARALC